MVMSDDEEFDESMWAAERRDFAADWRDSVAARRDEHADSRQATADERDQHADDREADLDAREQRLDRRAVDWGLQPTLTPAERELAAVQRIQAAGSRHQARQERQQRAVHRDGAAGARDEAAAQRSIATPTTQLALAFAEIAQHLYQATDFDEVLTRIVSVAVATVRGCEMASVTVREDTRYRTVASTHKAATDADHAQYEAGQGPCLDAVEEPIVYTPAFPDQRWPALAAQPTDAGVASSVSYRLSPSSPHPAGPLAGSLNAYAGIPDAFDAEAQEIGLILAAHASVAAGAMNERESLEQMSRHLREALTSRDVIGQAKGILMERLRVTPDEAFNVLRRSSQRLNIKLREVAARLAETGELHDTIIHPGR
jgi:hypothetical protein